MIRVSVEKNKATLFGFILTLFEIKATLSIFILTLFLVKATLFSL
jgi:hypothetical protein